MKVVRYGTITILFFMLGLSVYGAPITADEMIGRVDAHYTIANNFEMTIRVESYRKDRLQGLSVMKGNVDNGQLKMLTFTEPANMNGRKILIKDKDMWIIIPKVKNPIHVSPSQRLIGGISYSDVARGSFTANYTAKLSDEEQISGMNFDGTKSDPNQCFILELTAKEMRENYNKIIIWVEEQNFLPVKADFFALSGKKMTTVYYTGSKIWDGKIILTKMFLFDQINTAKHFSIEYSDIKLITNLENK
jgi:outer membrane lipoprotein-sorting protein